MENATLNNQNKLPISSDDLIKLLEDRKFKFDLITHKPLYTVNESKAFYEVSSKLLLVETNKTGTIKFFDN